MRRTLRRALVYSEKVFHLKKEWGRVPARGQGGIVALNLRFRRRCSRLRFL